MDDLGANSNKQNINLSENQNDIHGKKADFNLQSYFTKKWNLREKHRNTLKINYTKENKKWKFQYCCLLTIDEKIHIRPNEVFNTLKASLNESLENIVSIGQFASSKNWTIQFKDKTSYENNLGKEISILNVKHSLKDANQIEKKEKPENKYTMSVFVRIHWLPSGFKTSLTKFFKDEAKFLTVLEVKNETWEKGKSSIENGVYSVKVSYDIDDHANFLNFAVFHRVDGLGALIQINGAPPKCLQCNKWGHIRRDCPDQQKKCASCNKAGHEASNCWSSQAKGNNNNNIDAEIPDMDADNLVLIGIDTEQIISDQNGTSQEDLKIVGEKKSLFNPNNPFKIPTQDSELTIEIKKENMSQFSETIHDSIDSVLKKAMASPSSNLNNTRQRSVSSSSDISNTTTPKLVTSTTFDKIRNSQNSKNSKAEQKRLKDQEKKEKAKVEFNSMNATALQASKQVKRQSSTSSISSEHKKSLADDDQMD